MPFIILSGLITASIAGIAAYFSIYGLALIFAGAFWPVILMGTCLEVGKLSLTSIVYNHWDNITMIMRVYSVAAILILMVITSGGIYGFLSAAYQTDQVPLEQVNERIKLLDAEFKRKNDRLIQMDNIVAQIGANYITKRLEEKEQQKSERERLSTRLESIESEKLILTTTKIETEAHIGPIIYMAKVFNETTDDITNYLILLLIIVFDPLAVAMTIHVNMLLQVRNLKSTSPNIVNLPIDTVIEAAIGSDTSDIPDYNDKFQTLEQSIHKITDAITTLQQPSPPQSDPKQDLVNKLRS